MSIPIYIYTFTKIINKLSRIAKSVVIIFYNSNKETMWYKYVLYFILKYFSYVSTQILPLAWIQLQLS